MRVELESQMLVEKPVNHEEIAPSSSRHSACIPRVLVECCLPPNSSSSGLIFISILFHQPSRAYEIADTKNEQYRWLAYETKSEEQRRNFEFGQPGGLTWRGECKRPRLNRVVKSFLPCLHNLHNLHNLNHRKRCEEALATWPFKLLLEPNVEKGRHNQKTHT